MKFFHIEDYETFDEMGLSWFNWPLEYFISDKERISEFLPPILVKKALDGGLCLRNFALLVFGKKDSITRCFTEAYTVLSIYTGVDCIKVILYAHPRADVF